MAAAWTSSESQICSIFFQGSVFSDPYNIFIGKLWVGKSSTGQICSI
jgi:hypothetical protein